MIAVTASAPARSESQAAERYGTPLFFYSLNTLRGQIDTLRNAMSGYPVRLLFATMANDRAEILRVVSGEGVGACVNSIPHLDQCLANGFSADNMQFTSCGLPVTDMAYLQSLGVAVNLDSPDQIRAWCSLREGAVAGARINAAALTGTGSPDRIGMDLDDLEQARAIAREHGGRVNGLHVYVGTNFQSSREMLPTLQAMFNLAARYDDVEYVNIGGGVGVDYSHAAGPFDYHAFGAEACALARQAAERRGRPFTLLFEPGRSLVASSGVFITRVTDVKSLAGNRLLVVDASVSLFPRPYHHPGNYHHVRVLDGAPEDVETVTSTIVGRTTFSRDILGVYSLPRSLRVGSLLAFDDAGAYCESMMSRFLGQRYPACCVSED